MQMHSLTTLKAANGFLSISAKRTLVKGNHAGFSSHNLTCYENGHGSHVQERSVRNVNDAAGVT